MLWLYRLQQRLSITAAEGTALLVASGALVAPVPEAMHVSDRRLGGLLSPLIVALNRACAGEGDPARFDSWVMQFTAPG